MHDVLTERFMTGILHCFNQTFIEWFVKKQNTAETATCGSEFVAARLCAEQIVDLLDMLRHCGVLINERTHKQMNNTMITLY